MLPTDAPSRSSRDRSSTDDLPSALCVQDLHVTYPARRRQPAIEALRGVTMTIQPGQTVAMLGPNGSGKSTLMRVICGLLRPAAGRGRVAVFGHLSPSAIRRDIGVVFQHTALDQQLTVREALRDQARLYGFSRRDAAHRVEQDLEHAGLTDRRDQLIKTLSLGLARRVDLVRALLHRPRLLLLDEPTVGLDPTAREAFLRMLDDRRAESPLTVLLSTHLIDEADRQDRVILLNEGRLVADDAPTVLRRRIGSIMLTVHDNHWQPPVAERDCWREQAGAWVRSIGDDHETAARLAGELAGQGVTCTIAPPTLADAFEQLTGRRLTHSPSEATKTETAA